MYKILQYTIKCNAALLSGALYTALSVLKEYILQNTIHQIEDTSMANVIQK